MNKRRIYAFLHLAEGQGSNRSKPSTFGISPWRRVFMVLGLAFISGTLSAAVFDFSSKFQNVIWSANGSVMTYSVFDSDANFTAQDSDSTGTIQSPMSAGGVVAWFDNSFVYCRIYDANLRVWVKTNIALTGSASNLKTAQGVVAWSSGTQIQMTAYDAARQAWRGSQGISLNASLLRTSHGVVTWGINNVVNYRVYNPVSGTWAEASEVLASNLGNDLQTTQGIVAWSAGSTVYARTFDPTRTGWIALTFPFGSGSTFDLTAGAGGVTWSRNSVVYAYLYDPALGNWVGMTPQNLGFVSNLRLLNGTVLWNGGGTDRQFGYNATAQSWASATFTAPFARFGASTNAGNAPLRVLFFDLSLGASSWTWNFGDGSTFLFQQSPFHQFNNFGSNHVTLSVSGPGGSSPAYGLPIQSDVNPPTGTITINNGDALTTNVLVSLGLTAMDNSSVVTSMRFSNDGQTWSPWETFSPVKSWTLTSGNGTRTVRAQFQDPSHNVSAVVSDTIELDTTPPPFVLFDPGVYNVAENAGSVSVTIRLTSEFSRPVGVDFTTVDAGAVANEDYDPLQGHVDFNPGQTNKTIMISLLNDSAVELNEAFGIIFTAVTNANAGAAATINILDDDQPTVSFAASGFTAAENGLLANVQVQLSAGSGRLVRVNYATMAGTATPGVDYEEIESGVLTFQPGQTSVPISVLLNDDLLDEPNETVLLALNNPVNALLAAPATATLSIVDDDPATVSFASSAVYATEQGGSARINLVLSKPFDRPASVHYAVTAGTANFGEDFTADDGDFSLDTGKTNFSFVITIFNDGLAETLETVHVRLSEFNNVYAGSITETTLFIQDNDSPVLSDPRFNAQGWFQFTLRSPPGQNFVVETTTNFTHWTAIANLINTNGLMDFTDPSAPANKRRFYRARVP